MEFAFRPSPTVLTPGRVLMGKKVLLERYWFLRWSVSSSMVGANSRGHERETEQKNAAPYPVYELFFGISFYSTRMMGTGAGIVWMIQAGQIWGNPFWDRSDWIELNFPFRCGAGWWEKGPNIAKNESRRHMSMVWIPNISWLWLIYHLAGDWQTRVDLLSIFSSTEIGWSQCKCYKFCNGGRIWLKVCMTSLLPISF